MDQDVIPSGNLLSWLTLLGYLTSANFNFLFRKMGIAMYIPTKAVGRTQQDNVHKAPNPVPGRQQVLNKCKPLT